MRVFIPLRDDGPRRRFPVVTFALLCANVAVFAVQKLVPAATGMKILYAGGAIPYEISHLTDLVDGALQPRDLVPPPFTVLTSMFLHGGIEHLIGNLWFLWVFGDNVEDAMGPWRFLGFYLAIGTLAALAQCAMTP